LEKHWHDTKKAKKNPSGGLTSTGSTRSGIGPMRPGVGGSIGRAPHPPP